MSIFKIIKLSLLLLLIQSVAIAGGVKDELPPSIVDAKLQNNQLVLKLIDDSPILIYLYIFHANGKELKHEIAGQYTDNKIANVDFKSAGKIFLVKQQLKGLAPGNYLIKLRLFDYPKGRKWWRQWDGLSKVCSFNIDKSGQATNFKKLFKKSGNNMKKKSFDAGSIEEKSVLQSTFKASLNQKYPAWQVTPGGYLLYKFKITEPVETLQLIIRGSGAFKVALFPNDLNEQPLYEYLVNGNQGNKAEDYLVSLGRYLINPRNYHFMKSIGSKFCQIPTTLYIKIINPTDNRQTVAIEQLELIGKAKKPFMADNSLTTLELGQETTFKIDLKQYFNTSFPNWCAMKAKKWEIKKITNYQVNLDLAANRDNMVVLHKNSTMKIPLNNKTIGTLNFFHAIKNSKPGARIGSYIINYADGTVTSIPLITTINILNFNAHSPHAGSLFGPQNLSHSSMAYKVLYPAPSYSMWYGIYQLSWTNPYPEKKVAAIVIKYDNQAGELGVLGIYADSIASKPVKTHIIPVQYIYSQKNKIQFDLIVENLFSKKLSGTLDVSLRNAKGNKLWSKHQAIKLKGNDYVNQIRLPELSLTPGHYILDSEYTNGATKISDKIEIAIMSSAKKKHRAEYIMYGAYLSERAVKKISDLGFDKIQLLVRWKNLEKSPGKYDFEPIDRVLMLLKKYNMKLEISIGAWATEDYGSSYMVPKWIKGRMISNRGAKVKSGTIWDQQYTGTLCKLWEAIAERYKDNPIVDGYLPRGPGNDHELAFSGSSAKTYSNDYHIYDYSEYAQKDWPRYLKARGYSLDKVKQNIKIGPMPKSWNRVRLPIDKKYVSELLWKEFMHFRRDKVAEFYSVLCEAIRKHDKQKKIIIGHSGGWIPWGNLQGSYFDDLAKLAGKYNAVIQKTGCEWRDQFIVMSEIAPKYNTMIYSAELAQIPPVKDNFKIGLYWLMLHRVPAMTYVHWGIGEPFGNWAKWKPYLELIINSDRVYDNIELLIATLVPVDMGIYAKSDVDKHRNRVSSFGYFLGSQNYQFKLTTDQVNNTKFGANHLIDGNTYRISPELSEQYLNFVKNGGTLLLPFYSDSENSYRFQESLGIKINEAKSKSLISKGIFDKLPATVGKGICFSGNGKTLVKWGDGSTAIMEQKIGRGKVVMLGFPVIEKYGLAKNREFFNLLLSSVGVKRKILSNMSNLVEMGLFKKDNRYLITAFNHSAKTITPELIISPKLVTDGLKGVTDIVTQQNYNLIRKNGKYIFKPMISGKGIAIFSLTK